MNRTASFRFFRSELEVGARGLLDPMSATLLAVLDRLKGADQVKDLRVVRLSDGKNSFFGNISRAPGGHLHTKVHMEL